MRKSEVSIGRTYAVKVSGRVCPVRLESESGYGGWNGRNIITSRTVRIKTAAKLRHELEPWGTNLGTSGLRSFVKVVR